MPGVNRAAVAAVVILVGAIAGCGGSGAVAPVDSFDADSGTPPSSHTVKRGETLYSIAWLYGLDYRNLAAHNGIREPFTIYPGQRIAIGGVSAADADSESGAPTENRAVAKDANGTRWKPVKGPEAAESAGSGAPAPKPRDTRSAPPTAAQSAAKKQKAAPRKPAPAREVKGWIWPTKGTVITNFARSGRKGVNISGRAGQPVVAAAGGRVVYAGGGLRGYGELIIVKHNKRFLSAYAHNNRILVKEGDNVRVGQRIAEMGSTGTDKVMLHFEIRRDGKPVDPVRYLPK